MTWATNITGLDEGIYRTIKGNADELIGIGRCIKAGFQCSRVDITNGKYDAIVDSGKLLRIQIKGTSTGTLDFTGGGRSGRLINREVKQNVTKYTKSDCDVLMGVDSKNGDCYIIPVEDLGKWGNTKNISRLQEYKERWDLLLELAK